MGTMTPSPVDRIPKVGEVWRLAATQSRPSIEAEIQEVVPGKRVFYVWDTGEDGTVSWSVFRASARFLRER